jgi:RNA polymerase subunit RPABC4/transcription elongation factor Spt4
VDRTTDLSAIGESGLAPSGVQACDNCGEPGVLNADRHCPVCAKLAHEVDDYGTAVALDLLRTAVIAARTYATRHQIADTVDQALDDYDA